MQMEYNQRLIVRIVFYFCTYPLHPNWSSGNTNDASLSLDILSRDDIWGRGQGKMRNSKIYWGLSSK